MRVFAEDIDSFANARIVAAVIYRNKIVSVGCNQEKTHPEAVKYSKNKHAIYLHAEVDAIIKAKKKLTPKELKKSTLLIVRVRKQNSLETAPYVLGLAKPCCGCSKCIAEHEIKKVIYTDNMKDVSKLKYIVEMT